jgi:hypothetical protein
MKLSEALHIVGTGLAYERSSKQQVQSGGRRCLELEKEALTLEQERDALKADIDMLLKQPQGQVAFNAGMERAAEIAEDDYPQVSAAIRGEMEDE